MDTTTLARIAQLPDSALIAEVYRLARHEREATAALIAHLAVFDDRRLFRGEGCSSLFAYCTQVLRLSEHAAYARIEAARAVRKFPVVLEMLAEGAVNLTSVVLLAPHLTPENHRMLLDGARHKSRRQVEELVATLRPQPAVPSTVRRLPLASGTPAPSGKSANPPSQPDMAGGEAVAACSHTGWVSGEELCLQPSGVPIGLDAQASAVEARQGDRPTLAAGRRPIIQPLAPQQYRVQFTAGAETYEKLRRAQDLLRHQIPNGDIGEIMDRALTVLLEHLARRKYAAVNHPRRPANDSEPETDRPQPRIIEQVGSDTVSPAARAAAGQMPETRSRYIPADVKRQVWVRDGGRCAFVAQNGQRCAGSGFLEFHHVVPHAAGGMATVENIQLRCRAHNGYEAERYFGPAHATGVKKREETYHPAIRAAQGAASAYSVRTESG